MPRISLILIVALFSLVLGACASTGGSGTAAAVPIFEVTARSLNVRQEPTTSGAIVGSVKQGERLDAPQPIEGGWLYVETASGVSGYVSAQYVRPVEGAVSRAKP